MVIWLQFIVCTALIVFSGSLLSKYGDVIAEKTGMVPAARDASRKFLVPELRLGGVKKAKGPELTFASPGPSILSVT